MDVVEVVLASAPLPAVLPFAALTRAPWWSAAPSGNTQIYNCKGAKWPHGHGTSAFDETERTEKKERSWGSSQSIKPLSGPPAIRVAPSVSLPLTASFYFFFFTFSDLCPTSVITVPTTAAVRCRWGGAQTCPITWEQQLASSAAKCSCNFPFSLISLTLACRAYLCDSETLPCHASVSCFLLGRSKVTGCACSVYGESNECLVTDICSYLCASPAPSFVLRPPVVAHSNEAHDWYTRLSAKTWFLGIKTWWAGM